MEVVGETDKTGTIISFRPDGDIFKETLEFDYDTLASRVRELAFLNKGLTINMIDKRPEGKQATYFYEGESPLLLSI